MAKSTACGRLILCSTLVDFGMRRLVRLILGGGRCLGCARFLLFAARLGCFMNFLAPAGFGAGNRQKGRETVRLTLPAAEQVKATPSPTNTRRVPSMPFPRATGYRHDPELPAKRLASPKAIVAQVDETTPYRFEGLTCSEEELPGFFGPIRLKVTRSSVDLRRLRSGTMSVLREHDPEQAVGVTERFSFVTTDGVRGAAIMGRFTESPIALQTIQDAEGGSKVGLSPGFIFGAVEMEAGDDGEFVTVINELEIYENSLVSSPRLWNATLSRLGRFNLGQNSMRGEGMNAHTEIGKAPTLSNLDDIVGLSLNAGRRALEAGTGMPQQRERLGRFYKAFDAALERGLSRSAAVEVAKDKAGM